MVRERILRLGPSKSLVGLWTPSETGQKDAPTVLFLNAGITHRVGPNRLYVKLARRLARIGIGSFRFDLSGLGDSQVRKDGLPYRESRISETADVMDYLEAKKGVSQFIVLGLCSGADHAFRAACADPRVQGAIFLNGYTYTTYQYHLRHYAGRLLKWESWANVLLGRHPMYRKLGTLFSGKLNAGENGSGPVFVMDIPPREEAEQWIQELLVRGVDLLFVFTGRDTGYNYRKQLWDMFNVSDPEDRLQVEHIPDADHTFTLPVHQEELTNRVCEWASIRFGLSAQNERVITFPDHAT